MRVEKTRYGKVMWNWWASVALMLSRTGSVSPDSIYDFHVQEVVGATFWLFVFEGVVGGAYRVV